MLFPGTFDLGGLLIPDTASRFQAKLTPVTELDAAYLKSALSQTFCLLLPAKLASGKTLMVKVVFGPLQVLAEIYTVTFESIRSVPSLRATKDPILPAVLSVPNPKSTFDFHPKDAPSVLLLKFIPFTETPAQKAVSLIKSIFGVGFTVTDTVSLVPQPSPVDKLKHTLLQ